MPKPPKLTVTPSKSIAPRWPRICHLADIHLGYRRYTKLTKGGLNQREVDVNIAFQECISRIISLKPDLTVIAGDLFHAVRPSNTVVTFCFRQIRRLVKESGAPVVIVGGNHETPKRADTGSVLRLFAEIEGVFVSDLNPERFAFPELNLSVQCLSHAALSEGVPQLRADDRYKYNILVLHAQVEERWMSEFGGVEVALRSLSPHEWNYIAFGHVHLYREIGLNGAYSGAIEHTASNIWGESKEPKGFLEVHVESCTKIFHPLTSPREVIVLDTINAESLTPEEVSQAIKERIEAVTGGIDGKILRLEVQNIPRETYRYLNHRELRSYRAAALNFTLDLRSSTENDLKHSKHGQLRSLREELSEFCKEKISPEDERSEMSQLLLTYLDNVEAQNETV